MAHTKWSSKETLHFVAADTDILSILLLNFSEFREKQVILDQSAHLRLLDINALVEAIENDQDQDMMIMKQRRLFPLSFFFGMTHALIGTDILCSPRGFGPQMVLKTCIDFASYLFQGENSLYHLKIMMHSFALSLLFIRKGLQTKSEGHVKKLSALVMTSAERLKT